ncbi:MAG TPA: hypothetical protein VFI13_00090 [Gemmatimonadales bacterium]|nr:hypothetical protein [Gemmatimonadales bacterium]
MLSPRDFALRILRHVAIAQVFVAFSLAVGMVGYRITEGLAWVDGFLESAMLLGGMGPVHPPVTEAGKLFDGFFALYAGLLFIAIGGFVLAPVLHRVLHRLKLDESD